MFILSKIPPVVPSLLVGLVLIAVGRAQESDLRTAALHRAIVGAVLDTQAEFTSPALKADQLGVTVIDLRGAASVRASYRGGERFYPASVIKLCFLAYSHRLMEDGKLADTPELRRGLRDMIVDSYNEATSYVVDAITGT